MNNDPPINYMTSDQKSENEVRFTYHAPKPGQPERYVKIRDKALELANVICECCPPTRERATALTQLQLVSMLANASIACSE